MRNLFNSLGRFVMSGVMIVSLFIFAVGYVFSIVLFENIIKKDAIETSRAISKQTFSSMFQVMRRGWTRPELEEFLEETRQAFADTNARVEIYRGPVVEQLFGKIEQNPIDDVVEHVLTGGEEKTLLLDTNLRFVFPLKARQECLRCHVNANENSVLGAIEVARDLKPAIRETRSNYLWFLILFAPAPIIFAYIIANLFAGRLDRSVKLFRSKVDKVSHLNDVGRMDLEETDLGFRELNDLLHNFSVLIRKLQEFAIDKDILEFEIRLVEKLIITTEVINDWKEYMRGLLNDINSIIEAEAIYTLFRKGDDEFELEIFWLQVPQDYLKDAVVAELKKEMKEKNSLGVDDSFVVVHTIFDESSQLAPTPPQAIVARMSYRILPSPIIGGVLGVGIQSGFLDDPGRRVIIESILTTLINAVGAVRAVYKYTKDLEYYATRDPLTNLFNQRVFWDLLEYETGRADRHHTRFGLLVIDMDNFKTINDRYGHSFGDLFLKEFAHLLRETTRREDITARYGGDEFTIILPEADENQSYLIATRIRDAMEKLSLTAPDSAVVKATVSIGVTVYPDHGTTARDLFLVADNMMYRAKREGKNALVFPNEEDVAEVFKKIGEKSIFILNAIEEKRITPFYQPIVDLHTGDIEIHELLMRVETNGNVAAAAEFIEVAENMGVVHKLDYIMLEKAFEQIQRNNYKGKLFVNLSPKALIIAEFIRNVRDLARDHQIDPSMLVFEITERETVRSLSLLEKFVHDLKGEGFQFAIDDFGSGFSSFSYLKRFPIDYVKIDGEFIRNMVLDSRDRAVVMSVITLAHELKIKTIAEYVESEEILANIREAGIDYAQGFHVGRPNRFMRM